MFRKNKKEELINHLKRKKKKLKLCERFKRSARGSIAPITPTHSRLKEKLVQTLRTSVDCKKAAEYNKNVKKKPTCTKIE
ncbi:unnamed protein product [Meloidogyne enterolobii]|uniref:Uncharacterized protein n=1 Tax=Meloidogyne enterolobii TaxID=390850 RepID=A0ACB0YWU4_MELEN